MRLLIVIVNYRTARLVIDCLHSLAEQVAAVGSCRVVVTDNASGDDSVSVLQSAIEDNHWSSWVKLVPLDHNGGFAYGNNQAIRPALKSQDPPQYVLLLNPDTIARPGAVMALLEFLESRPDVGIAGARLEFPDGTPQATACRFPSMLGEIENTVRLGVVTRLLDKWVMAPPVPREARPVDWVSGACLIARRDVFEQVGLMDEGYFMYYEEVDFCLRAKHAGWSCWYVPAARVIHLIGQSSAPVDPSQPRRRRPRYWFASRKHYYRNHFGRARTFIGDIVWALGYGSYRVRRLIQRKPDIDNVGMLWDFIRYNFFSRHAAK